MRAAKRLTQFSIDQVNIFLLQDNKGYHIFLQHPLWKKQKEEDTRHSDDTQKTFVIKKRAFSTMTSKEEGRMVAFCATNKMLNNQTTSLSARSRTSQSPSLSAARTINYYLSTGLLHVSEKNVLPILEISLRLGLTIVQEACTLLLSKTLTIGSWSEILRLAKDYHSRSLANTFTRLTSQHIMKCLTRKDLVSLIGALMHSKIDRNSLKYFLKRFLGGDNKKFMIKTMFELFNSEAKMLQFCFKDSLESDVKKLAIKHIDNSDNLTDVIKTNTTQTQTKTSINDAQNAFCQSKPPSMERNQSYRQSRNLQTPYQTHAGIKKSTAEHWPQNRETIVTLDTNQQQVKEHRGENLLPKQLDKNSIQFNTTYHSPTTPSSCRTLIMISGGITNEQKPEPTNLVFKLSQSNDQWVRMPSMNIKRYNHSIVSMGDKVIAIGGNTESRTSRDNTMKGNSRMSRSKKGISINDTLYRRNLLEPSQTNSVEQLSISDDGDEWSTFSSMILSREEHCSVVVGEHVYTVGGHDGVCQLCSVERYNPIVNRWSLEKPMSRLRAGACAVTDGRYIYVIGGYGGLQWLNTIECYDTTTKSWSRDLFPPMAERRGYACAEMLDNDIYVFGGTNDHENLKTCEVFNTNMKEWRKGPSMNQPRLNAGHCVFKGRILVLGGESNGKFLDTVEELDIAAWQWKPFCRLPVKLAGLKCTVVNSQLPPYVSLNFEHSKKTSINH